MEKDSTTVKAVEKFMEVKFDVRIEDKYRVNLTDTDYFEVDSFLINGNRFVNLRSVHGRISGKEFSISDSFIRPIVHDYLRYQNNVELINILSRELNKFNYFEIYDDESEKTDMKLSKQEILNESSHAGIPACGYINKIINDKGMILPNELYKYLNPRIPMFTSVNYSKINFYPIWFFDGNKLSKHTKLTCHFDILVHILSKVFIDFKALILKLAGTDIQIAKEKNQTVEDYSEHSKDELIKIINAKDMEISTLRFDFAKFREESDRKHEELMRELAESNRKHDETIRKLDESKRILEETKQESNQKFTELENSSRTRHEEYMKMIDRIFSRTSTDVVQTFPNEKITTGTAREVMVFINSEELNRQFDLLEFINENELALDSVVCQRNDLDKQLRKHGFDNTVDRIIFQCPTSNSLDIFKYIDTNINRNIARIHSSTSYRRKIIVNRSRIEEFLGMIQTYVNSVTISRETLTSTIESAQEILTSYIHEKMEETSRDCRSKMYRDIQEVVREEVQQVRDTVQETVTQVRQEIHEEIQETREQVRTIQEQAQTQVREAVTQIRETIQEQVMEEVNRTVEEVIENRLLQYINQHNYRKIWYNNYYRDIHLRNGKVYVYLYVSSNQLTEVPDDRDPRNRKYK